MPPRPSRLRALGLDRSTIAASLPRYPGLPHRQELVAVIDGVPYVNDSKATNADAAARALACYEAVYWIAGGVPKAGGIATLAPQFAHIAHAFLIGEAAGTSPAPSPAACLRRWRATSGTRCGWPRNARRPNGGWGPSCCCRRPAPPSTSFAISRIAATASVPWSRPCRAAGFSWLRRSPRHDDDPRTDTSLFGQWWWTVDRWTVFALAAIIGIGALMLLAASPPVAERIGLEPLHFVKRQMLLLPLAIGVIFFVSLQPPRIVRRLALAVFCVSVIMLALTFVMGPRSRRAAGFRCRACRSSRRSS